MTLRRFTTFACVPLLWSCALIAPAQAAPPSAAQLPQNAKWVIHIDLNALVQTELADEAREQRPRMTQLMQRWFEAKFGVNPREDLDSLTLFGDSYDEHTGTMVLHANYEIEKVRAALDQDPNIAKEAWENYTLYTIQADPQTFLRAANAGDNGQQRTVPQRQQGAAQVTPQQQGVPQPQATQQQQVVPQQQAAQPRQAAQPGGRRQGSAAADRSQPSRSKSMTLVLVDGKSVVIASSADRAKKAVALVSGNAPALAADSPLLSEVTEGSLVYGAAIDLQQIEQRDGFFPVLAQHERIYWTVVGNEGQVGAKLTLHTESEEVAEKMQKSLEGSVAFGQVWAADSENLSKLFDSREVSRDGKTVELKGQSDVETVRAAIGELRERFRQRFQIGDDQAADNRGGAR